MEENRKGKDPPFSRGYMTHDPRLNGGASKTHAFFFLQRASKRGFWSGPQPAMIHPPSAAGWRQSTAPPLLVPPLQPQPPMQSQEGGGLPFVRWRRIEEKKGLLLAYLQVIYLSLFPGCQEKETCRRDKKDRDKRERENGRNGR